MYQNSSCYKDTKVYQNPEIVDFAQFQNLCQGHTQGWSVGRASLAGAEGQVQIRWSVAEEIPPGSEWLKCPSWFQTDEWDLHRFNSNQKLK